MTDKILSLGVMYYGKVKIIKSKDNIELVQIPGQSWSNQGFKHYSTPLFIIHNNKEELFSVEYDRKTRKEAIKIADLHFDKILNNIKFDRKVIDLKNY